MDDDLEVFTVQLVPKAALALRTASALTADTQTDTINRALIIYSALVTENITGAKVKIVHDDGRVHDFDVTS